MTPPIGPDIVDQLRAVAGRTADVDDHITIHLCADEIMRLRSLTSPSDGEAREVARLIITTICVDPLKSYSAAEIIDLQVRAVTVARALLSHASDGGWQPIAEAPKDGTPILLWDPSQGGREHYMPNGALRQGEYSYTTADDHLKWYDDRRYAIGYWRPWAIDGKTPHPWGNRNSSWPEPTHWQPLPAPPTSTGRRTGDE